MKILSSIACLIMSSFIGLASSQEVPLNENEFTSYVAALLKKSLGDGPVEAKAPLTIGLGPLQANLDRIFGFCKSNQRACSSEVDRYVAGASEAYRYRTAPPTKSAVRIVVRSKEYVEAARSNAGSPGPIDLQPRDFIEGLVALPALDGKSTLKMLGVKDNDALGLTAQEAYELGLSNLRKELKPLMEVAKVPGRGQIGQLVGDFFHPSRLLLHETWAPLVKEMGGVLIVAIPVTDALIYVGEDTERAIDALRTLTKNAYNRAPNKLSATLLRWREAGWEVVK
jgi:uncharacterized protein YtpQ (UPF0354 family)